MPLYDYACKSCGKTTEILQRFEDPPLTICPHCGGELKKLLSAPAFHLKGSGWYATDYGRKSGAGGGSKSSGESGAGGSSAGESAKSEKSESKGGEGSSPAASPKSGSGD